MKKIKNYRKLTPRIVLLLLFLTAVNQLEAQTKAETINWLAQKFSSYGRDITRDENSGIVRKVQKWIEIDNSEIKIKYINKEDNTDSYSTISIDQISDIYYYEDESDNGNLNFLEIKAKGQNVKNYSLEWKLVNGISTGTYKNLEYSYSLFFALEWKNEYDLKKRVVNALDNLSKLNLKKEVF